MTIFFCGLTMSYYVKKNLSDEAKENTHLTFETLGGLCEAFAFSYMGFIYFNFMISYFYKKKALVTLKIIIFLHKDLLS